MNKYPIAGRVHTINGVLGHMPPVPAPRSTRESSDTLCHTSQVWHSTTRPIRGYGTNGTIKVRIRFDDHCNNGHQSFGITADITTSESRRRNDVAACGCLHEEIVKVFPELEPLIKWHLMQTDGPMHYVANTVYRAGNRDHHGKLKGEPYSSERCVMFGDSPMTHKYSQSFLDWLAQCDRGSLRMVEVAGERSDSGFQYSSNYTVRDDRSEYVANWTKCPFKNRQEADEFIHAAQVCVTFIDVPTQWGEGKERELDKARNGAIWPEATDEQLCLPKEELIALLNARLPALIAEFRKDMDACGFLWEVQP